MSPDTFNPIAFKKELAVSRVLQRDESGEFAEAAIPVEFRFDPLTGRTCRVVQFPLERINRPDLAALEKQSRELFCSFCPGNTSAISTRFPPELAPDGIIRVGKAFGFPNSGPYDVYGMVVVMTDEHFVRPDGFDLDTVHDTLLASQQCLAAAQRAAPAAKYPFIAWNYMPPSGGSLVHPHMQCNTGCHPTNYQKLLLDASDRYHEKNGTNYWSDLLEQEKRAGERYIGCTGNVEWLTAFMPRGRLSDVLAVFPGRASIMDVTADDLRDFAAGLLRVFNYIDGLNLISFNMATFSGSDSGRFWAHAVVMPRGSLLYSPMETSDQFYYTLLHEENACILSPEAACERLKRYFTV